MADSVYSDLYCQIVSATLYLAVCASVRRLSEVHAVDSNLPASLKNLIFFESDKIASSF